MAPYSFLIGILLTTTSGVGSTEESSSSFPLSTLCSGHSKMASEGPARKAFKNQERSSLHTLARRVLADVSNAPPQAATNPVKKGQKNRLGFFRRIAGRLSSQGNTDGQDSLEEVFKESAAPSTIASSTVWYSCEDVSGLTTQPKLSPVNKEKTDSVANNTLVNIVTGSDVQVVDVASDTTYVTTSDSVLVGKSVPCDVIHSVQCIVAEALPIAVPAGGCGSDSLKSSSVGDEADSSLRDQDISGQEDISMSTDGSDGCDSDSSSGRSTGTKEQPMSADDRASGSSDFDCAGSYCQQSAKDMPMSTDGSGESDTDTRVCTGLKSLSQAASGKYTPEEYQDSTSASNTSGAKAELVCRTDVESFAYHKLPLHAPEMVMEYFGDVVENMLLTERKPVFTIASDFLPRFHINKTKRARLVDWLICVQMRYKLLQETLFLAVSILDRYLSKKDVTNSQLQLVGLTSLLVASKYEECTIPEVEDFAYISDYTYSCDELVEFEWVLLQTLDLTLGKPISLRFLRLFSVCCSASGDHHAIAKFFIELALLSATMSSWRPSFTAASALYLAVLLHHKPPLAFRVDVDSLCEVSRFSVDELQQGSADLANLYREVKTAKQKLVSTIQKHSLEQYNFTAQWQILNGLKLQNIAMASNMSGFVYPSTVHSTDV